jgi:hypothetical protein
VNRAVAMAVAGDRLGIYQEGTGLRVRLNGVDREFTGSTRLPKGGTLTHGGDQYEVRWPDGSRVWVQVTGGWGLKVDVLASSARAGTTRGLLGDFDGNPDNDLASPSGSALPASPSFDQLYRVFAPGWQVTAATSLFDYPSGQSPKTFADPTFPDDEVTRAGLDAAMAEQICRSAGVTAAPFLDDCVLDVALTGQSDFVTSAAQDQASAVTAPNTGGSGKQDTVHPNGTLHDGDTVRGQITQKAGKVVYPLDVGDATVVQLEDVTGDPPALRIEIAGPDGGQEPGFMVTRNNQWRVVPHGSYQLVVSRPDEAGGAYSFRIVTAKERRLATTLGSTVDGRLDLPGRVDLHALTVTEPTKIKLTGGAPCEGVAVAVVEDGPQPRAYSPAGPCFDIPLADLEPGKHYLIVVWSAAAHPVDYRFTITRA